MEPPVRERYLLVIQIAWARPYNPFWISLMRIRYVLEVLVALPLIFQALRLLIRLAAAVARGPIANKCPICVSNRTRPSMPRLADLILPAFIAARRCENCDSRYFVLRSVDYVRRAQRARVAAPRRRSSPVHGFSRSQV
jgi:hypothetical protein